MKLATSPLPEIETSVRAVNIAVVDDHGIIRAIFKSITEDAPDLQLNWTAVDLGDARRQLVTSQPDLLIVDVSLPDGDGFELIPEVLQTWPETRVLMISMHEDRDYAMRARELGACGYMIKSSSPKELLGILQRVSGGEEYFENL